MLMTFLKGNRQWTRPSNSFAVDWRRAPKRTVSRL
jgi:hypothetical protein